MRRTIERLSPEKRPPGPSSGHQDWRDLLFLHWPAPVEELQRALPAGLSLDLHQGTAYLGLVPFLIERARPRFWPAVLGGLSFPETNVRTYVHRQGEEAGVYFFSLDAASRLAVAAARLGFGLPYFHARMRQERRGELVEYEARRLSGSRPRLFLRYRIGESLPPSSPGTLQHFLIERYLLHVERRGRMESTQVRHQPYPLREARLLELEDELMAAAGLPAPAGPPPLVHWSPGVEVEVFGPFRR